jgi:hypothetical protein
MLGFRRVDDIELSISRPKPPVPRRATAVNTSEALAAHMIGMRTIS